VRHLDQAPPTSSFPSGHLAAAICFYGALALLADDLPLFSAALRQTTAAAKPAGLAEPSPIEAALAEVHPDELTPRAALDLVYRLTALLRAGGKEQA
jgi:hypothetical protein